MPPPTSPAQPLPAQTPRTHTSTRVRHPQALTGLLRGPSLAKDALCAKHPNPDLWFSTSPTSRTAAWAICRACPVCADCRELGAQERYGTWGGRWRSVRTGRQLAARLAV
jgi:hypothetical protein